MGHLRSVAASIALLAAVALPREARAIEIAPTTSYDGSYTVSWPDSWPRLRLYSSYNGGAWSFVAVTGTYSRAFTGMALGTYSYKLSFEEYDAELRGWVLVGWSNVATVVVATATAPGTPGPITAPTGSSTGSYTVSWGTAPGTVDRYELFENGAVTYSGTALAVSITGRQNGTYVYKARACNVAGCGGFTNDKQVTVVPLPGIPGAITGPTSSTTGSYTVGWGAASGTVDRYDLYENGTGASVGTVLSKTYTGKGDGTYTYKVQACNASGCGPFTADKPVTVLLPPGSPGAITAPTSSTSGSYTVSWGAASGTVARYDLYENGTLTYSGTALTKSVSGKGYGTYTYKVQACNASGCGPFTADVSVSVTLPGAPGAITAPSTSTTGSYTLSWGAALGTVSRYDLYENGTTVHSGSGLSYAVSGKGDGTYTYKVQACNTSGCGPFTANTSVTVLLVPGTPGPITGPTSSTTGSYTVSWGAASGTIARYDMYENGTLSYSGTALTFGATGKSNGTYTYKVQACNASGCGPFTANYAVTVLTQPPVPAGFTAPGTAGADYSLTWQASSGADRYELDESSNQANWTTYTLTATSKVFTGKGAGAYYYRVRACNTVGCSGYAGTSLVTVTTYLSGPTQSSGTYTLTWTQTGDLAEFQESPPGASVFTTIYKDSTHTSYTATQTSDGVWRYRLQYCTPAEPGGLQEPGTPEQCHGYGAVHSVTVSNPPSTPGPLSFAVDKATGSYTVSWGASSGTNVEYWLETLDAGGAWVNAGSNPKTTLSYAVASPGVGTYYYRVKACNTTACSAYTAPGTVTVWSELTRTVEDHPLVTPYVPPQEWVGTLPGTSSADGGAAGYHIDIEVPPGRAGMQPSLALAYASKGGNGIAGVGWSLSGTSSIYRCPRTLAQDGGNRPVQYDGNDRFCFDGRRLIATLGSYGSVNSQYRAEVDDFDRITLRGEYFEVVHKSGRISHYVALQHTTGLSPDIWYLMREFDQQGNCVNYAYSLFSSHTSGATTDLEFVLSRVSYTGRRSGDLCDTGGDARHVDLQYSSDREDKRTTYEFGQASMSTARLSAIVTSVGATPVRRYELGYKTSVATRRSLLTSITLCAGGVCGAEKLPATSFTYQEDQANFVRRKTATGANTWISTTVDYDGDGTRDTVTKEQTGTGYRWTLTLSSGCAFDPYAEGSSWLPFDQPFDTNPTRAGDDFNNDGRADLIGTAYGYLAFGTRTCGGVTIDRALAHDGAAYIPFPTVPLDSSNPDGPRQTAATSIDYDGDGLLDVAYWGGAWDQRVLRRLRNDALVFDEVNVINLPQPMVDSASAVGASQSVKTRRDFNGDGLVDTFFDRVDATVPSGVDITFFRGIGTSDLTHVPIESLGGPSGSFEEAAHKSRRWIDVNGDGLPDIYEPGFVWVNRGGPAGRADMFERKLVSSSDSALLTAVNRAPLAFVMDIDSDGEEELLVPTERTLEYCGAVPSTGGEQESSACGSDFDARVSWIFYDRSVFRWDAYKFRETSTGDYEAVRVATNLEVPANYPISVTDYGGPFVDQGVPTQAHGDGMHDVGYRLISDGSHGIYPGLAASDVGSYVSWNQARAPDLLASVTNGLGALSAWTHQPLSLKKVPDGCAGELDFYVVHHDAARSPGYVFFASSMWAVSRFDTSHGVDASPATNATCYRYEDAMLNVEGRGFQGFKKIVAEERLPPALGEVGAAPGTCGAGASGCSKNNLRTTTEFHQEFPLTNRVKTVTVELASGGTSPLSTAQHWWHSVCSPDSPCGTSDLKAWIVYESGAVEKKYDLSQAMGQVASAEPLLQTTRVVELDARTGEPKVGCTILDEVLELPKTGGGFERRRQVTISKETRDLDPDLVNWWPGRIRSVKSESDFLPTAFVVGDTPALPLACPALSTLSPDGKSRITNYTWYPATGTSGYNRKLHTDELMLKGAVEARTTYATYDYAGNLTSMQVAARDASTDPYIAATRTEFVTLPETTYTYSQDQYFRETETSYTRIGSGAVAHTSTMTTDPATGLEIYREPIQTGPRTWTEYDSLGRVLSIFTEGGQPVYQRLLACGSCGNAVVARQVIQAGAPTNTEYTDRLGRVVTTATEGLDGRAITASQVEYTERGLKLREFAPQFSDAATAYSTDYSRFDALGRVGSKTVNRDPALFSTGKGAPSFTTDYAYDGLKTLISVHKADGGTLDMSRTADGRGKLVATMQRVTQPTTHDLVTHYVYDPSGGLTHIIDTAGNDLAVTMDDLGRKTSVNDPDRGLWTFQWDGIGRPRLQKDARGNEIWQQYDALGRVENRFVKAPLDAGASVDATWAYDQNGIGALAFVVAADGFRRDYLYDTLMRPYIVTTKVPKLDAATTSDPNFRTFVVEYGYDKNYGRTKVVRYPAATAGATGERVVLEYGDRGHLVGETELLADGTRGKQYRRVRAMGPRGEVTDQVLGNCVAEFSQQDESNGMAVWMSAVRPTGAIPAHADLGTCPIPTQTVRQVAYAYDHLLNLQQQDKNFPGEQFTERYAYDELQRITSSTRSWVGLVLPPEVDTYRYDDLGNITTKSDYGTLYSYGDKSRSVRLAGPHAVASVAKTSGTTVSFTYDANGNLFQGDGRTVLFDMFDRPAQVTQDGITTSFSYGPDGGRYRQRTTGPATPKYGAKTVYYVDKDYELVVWDSPVSTEERTYVGGSVVLNRRDGGTRLEDYIHKDRLGSTDAITTDDPTKLKFLPLSVRLRAVSRRFPSDL